MTKKTTNLLGILITILAGTYFYITYCSECGMAIKKEPMKEAVIVPTEPEATSYLFAFSDGDYTYKENDNYNFNTSSSSILMPLSDKLNSGIASLKAFQAENSEKVVDTWYYKNDEANASAFPNLGLARASAVKNHLVENGISKTKIKTSSKVPDTPIAINNAEEGMSKNQSAVVTLKK